MQAGNFTRYLKKKKNNKIRLKINIQNFGQQVVSEKKIEM
jgi:hypothetical protein